MIWELMGVFRVAVSLEIHDTIQWCFEVVSEVANHCRIRFNSEQPDSHFVSTASFYSAILSRLLPLTIKL